MSNFQIDIDNDTNRRLYYNHRLVTIG